MAWRPDKCIVRGEVDNTERGRVVGRLWMLGREEPITLDLMGDAWPDLAGCKLTFTNPKPEPQPPWAELWHEQRGQVGDITASNKRRVFTASDDVWLKASAKGHSDEVPFEWRNSLYIEWFSERNGRVVIESSFFEINISERQWEVDEDEHQAQQMLNLQAMRDFLGTMIQRAESDTGEDKLPEEMSEEEWEEAFKQSDRLSDAALEAYEKFRDDPDFDEKEAFVMGWDHLSDSRDAKGNDESDEVPDSDAIMEEATESPDEGEEWKQGDDDDLPSVYLEEKHPLQAKAQEYALAATRKLTALGINRNEDDPSIAPNRFAKMVFQIMAKLSGALNRGPSDRRPKGYVLAITKRCLNWSNEALSALNELAAQHPESADALDELRTGLFEIRDGITDLRRELRGES